MLLGRPELDAADTSSLQCLWYGAAPMSVSQLEEAIIRLGPVLGQLFGQTEAPMMISTLAPAEHLNPDGSLARIRFASAGRPTPLVIVAIMDGEGRLLGVGERGEIVVRSSLVMAGYYMDPAATAEASRHGWHHTGAIGYLGEEGYLGNRSPSGRTCRGRRSARSSTPRSSSSGPPGASGRCTLGDRRARIMSARTSESLDRTVRRRGGCAAPGPGQTFGRSS